MTVPDTADTKTTESDAPETAAAAEEPTGEEPPEEATAAGGERDEGAGPEPDPSRSTARVKVFDEERRYGFLQPLEGGRDVFVHASEVEGDDVLRPGDVVEYDLAEGDDGHHAAGVRVLERAPEDNPAGRVVTGGAPPTWDQLERIQRDMRQQRRQRRRRR
jgi:cold shock CspA family protein